MKATIIMIINILVGSVFAYAQNDSLKPNTVLYIIKTDTKTIKTNHFFFDAKDIQTMELPPKASASKSFGVISEDVVMIVSLKKDVKLYTWPMLLDKYKISTGSENLQFLLDGEPISNPADIVSTGDMVKSMNKVNSQITIVTKHPLKKLNSEQIKSIHY